MLELFIQSLLPQLHSPLLSYKLLLLPLFIFLTQYVPTRLLKSSSDGKAAWLSHQICSDHSSPWELWVYVKVPGAWGTEKTEEQSKVGWLNDMWKKNQWPSRDEDKSSPARVVADESGPAGKECGGSDGGWNEECVGRTPVEHTSYLRGALEGKVSCTSRKVYCYNLWALVTWNLPWPLLGYLFQQSGMWIIMDTSDFFFCFHWTFPYCKGSRKT